MLTTTAHYRDQTDSLQSGGLIATLKMECGGHTNYSYLIVDRASGHAAVVDPSWDLRQILDKLEELGANLKLILLTHAHFDHVNLVPALTRHCALQVVISAQEQDYYGFSCENLLPVRHLDRVQLGETSISCLLTPGHTAGGMCYLLPDGIFTGDTIFVEGCGSCAMPGASAESMFESIEMLKRSIGERVKVFPGHSYGGPIGCSFGSLLKDNIYFQFDRQDQFVKFRMRAGQPGRIGPQPL